MTTTPTPQPLNPPTPPPSNPPKHNQAIVEWMEPARMGVAGVVITGDLNAPPGEAAHRVLQNAGYYSASKVTGDDRL